MFTGFSFITSKANRDRQEKSRCHLSKSLDRLKKTQCNLDGKKSKKGGMQVTGNINRTCAALKQLFLKRQALKKPKSTKKSLLLTNASSPMTNDK